MHRSRFCPKRRRGAIVVLAALLMVFMLGMIAFALDIGYIGLARTQLQLAADSAALAAAATTSMSLEESNAVAQQFANAHFVAGRRVQLNPGDVEYGSWDAATRTFTPSALAGTAVRVTVRTSNATGGETALFFSRFFGINSVEQQASAIATVNPRDIAFVVDVSRSMNFDTNPGQPSSTSELCQNVLNDFGFGAYPGAEQYVGQSLNIPETTNWKYELTKKVGNVTGPLWSTAIDPRYRVTKENDSKNEWKAYAYVMEVQIPSLIPNVIPVPDAGTVGSTSGANYKYWKAYIDWAATQINPGYNPTNRMGPKSYLTMMMDCGRDDTLGGSYTPLSIKSVGSSALALCPRNTWTVGGEPFSFPPREMPTHAARRAIIAAIQVIRDRNQAIADVNQKDWVSLFTFTGNGTETIEHRLSDDYAAAMQKCTNLQASSGTGTESGLYLAYRHLQYGVKSGDYNWGRRNTNKIIVLLTDGQPNDKRSTDTTVKNYVKANPSKWIDPKDGVEKSNWVTGGENMNEKNAALMQTTIMQKQNWYVFAAGIGGACDYDFMDRVARMGATSNTQGQSPRGSSDPMVYENKLKEIFENIITNPKLRLVQ